MFNINILYSTDMDIKNFTIESFKIPNTNEYMCVFNIKSVNGTNTRFEWAIFDDQNRSQEGVVYNTLSTSDLYFSVKLNNESKYFVLFREVDNNNNILTRSWDFLSDVRKYDKMQMELEDAER